MAQFKINVENAKLHAAIFDKAADELRKCSMEIEIIRDSLDPSLHELTDNTEEKRKTAARLIYDTLMQ